MLVIERNIDFVAVNFVDMVIIIPAFNEGERIGAVIASVLALGKVVVVDDGSADDTGAVARGGGAVVLRHVINRGQGAALQTGMEFALRILQAEVIAHFDADGQMRSEDLERAGLSLQEQGEGIVLGSRFLGSTALEPTALEPTALKPTEQGMTFSRLLVLQGGLIFTKIFSGVAVTDTHNGLRVMTAETAKKLKLTLDRMAHASEILDLIKVHEIKLSEVPIVVSYRIDKVGQSNWGMFPIVRDLLKKRLIG